MDKRIQALLLVLIFSIAVSARLAVLGWLMLFGFGSLVVLGILHFTVHFYCMNNLSFISSTNIIRVVISHFLFAAILLFQMDFDDSRSYSVLGNFLGFESEFLERQGYRIVGIALMFYIIQTIMMIRTVKKERIKGGNLKLLIPSILLALVLPNVFTVAGYKVEAYKETEILEETGEFYSLNRAIDNPEKVETLSIDSFQESLSEFPFEIFELVQLKHLNLKGHKIELIPDNISSLNNLETLNLLDNHLQAINPSICDCDNLVELRVGGEIATIPDCLKKMKTLKHLSFQSTHTNELLDELREFENLETAHFYLYTDWAAYRAMSEDGQEENSKNSVTFDNEKWNRIKDETGIKHKY